MANTAHHKVVIVGGGSAGISVTARLRRAVDDVAGTVMPKGVTWIKDAGTSSGTSGRGQRCSGCRASAPAHRRRSRTGLRLLAGAGRRRQDRRAPRAEHAGDVRCAGVRRCPRRGGCRLRHRVAPGGRAPVRRPRQVDVDENTHQHARYPNVFSLGDAGSTPNSKTGAAIREQAPVVAKNVLAQLGRAPADQYGRYASCPLTMSRHEQESGVDP